MLFWGFHGDSVVKKLPNNAGDRVRSLCHEDPLEKAMATHSSLLAWEIPWTEEPGGYGLLSHNRVSHDLVTKQQQLIYYFSCRSEFFIHFLKSFHFLSFTSLNVIWYNLLKIDL